MAKYMNNMNNMTYMMYGILVVIVVLITLKYISSLMTTKTIKEGYNGKEIYKGGEYPKSVDGPILDSFRYSGKKNVSNDSASDIWWYYPIFEVGSFEQLTNNLRHRYNPDNGKCSRAEFCGALYKNNHNVPSNITLPLPEAKTGPGARVNYYRTTPNLLSFSIPTNENILY